MEFILVIKAIVLGIVEGLTEFFPISSTGHLIVVADLIAFHTPSAKVFEVVIQLGAILAVVWTYRTRCLATLRGALTEPEAQRFIGHLLIAFLPAAAVGFIFVNAIKTYLFNAPSVAVALIIGGIIILLVERRPLTIKINQIDEMSWRDALKVGCAQVFALIPGTSRSGATIIGGMLFGLKRQTATEFSFFLAIPTMFAATLYDIYRHLDLFTAVDTFIFSSGFIAAFISAFFAVQALIRYIATHSFEVFAWYRIVFGLFILLSWYWGWVKWS